MNTYQRVLIVFLFVTGQVSMISALAELPPDLKQFRLDFHTQLAELDRSGPISELNEKYREYLEKEKLVYQEEGKLEAMLEVDEELENFANDQERELSSLPKLKRLQEIYREQRSAAESEVVEKKKELIRVSYEKAKELSVLWTKEGKIEEAKLALEESKEIAAMANSLATVAAVSFPESEGSSFSKASKEEPFENHLGMRFVPVPITGGPTDGKLVLFSIWETRAEDWEAFLKRNRDVDWERPDFLEDDHPAVNVTWENAVAFCEWLTEEERRKGLIGETQRYRLPSDHEWSCAVGIGEQEDASLEPAEKDQKIKDIFPWGTEWPPPAGAGNLHGEEIKNAPPSKRVLEGYEDEFVFTAPVGSFSPNDFGLYDLGGNAIEMCQDKYAATKNHPALRGGSYEAGFAGAFLASDRWNVRPNYNLIGFRCVLSE